MNKKRYILTTAQANVRPHKQFLEGLEHYAKIHDAEMLVLPTFGMNASERDMHTQLRDYTQPERDVVFNDSIKYEPRYIRPQAIDPTAGLNHIVGQGKSIIFAHPQIRVRFIPDGDLNKHPKALVTTGAVTLPNYSDKDDNYAERRRLGRIAKDHHQYGALLLEMVGSKRYHFRHLEADTTGKFVDLGLGYNGTQDTYDSQLEAMVLGDVHNGRQDPIVQDATDRMITEYRPKRIVVHDFVDMLSINPHDSKELIYSQIREKVDKGNTSLEKELREAHSELLRLHELSNGANMYLVPCNHHEFLNRWLDEGKFVMDASNARLGFKIAEAYSRGKDPTEFGIKHVGGKLPSNIRFLNYDQKLQVRGWELSNHGHKGPSGGYGSMRSKEYMYGKSITGHCHSHERYHHTHTVGVMQPRNVHYMKGSPSKWTNTHALLWDNGKPQYLNIIDGKYKLQ